MIVITVVTIIPIAIVAAALIVIVSIVVMSVRFGITVIVAVPLLFQALA